MEDDPLVIYFRLAEAGYGSVDEIEKWGARKVLQAIHRVKFLDEYEAAYVHLLKQESES